MNVQTFSWNLGSWFSSPVHSSAKSFMLSIGCSLSSSWFCVRLYLSVLMGLVDSWNRSFPPYSCSCLCPPKKLILNLLHFLLGNVMGCSGLVEESADIVLPSCFIRNYILLSKGDVFIQLNVVAIYCSTDIPYFLHPASVLIRFSAYLFSPPYSMLT